jgi:two-component system, NtrC family, sensor histidine kinase AtoS
MTNQLGASPPSKASIWRGKNPSLADMGVLLDHISDAAVIIERAHGSILLVNHALLTLSTYSSADLTHHPLQEILPETMEQSLAMGEEKIYRLVRKNRTPIEVKARLSPLDAAGNWGIVTFQPLQHQLRQNWHEILLNGLFELSQLAGKGNLQNALEHSVQILHDVLGLELIGVYRADSDYPRLRLDAAFDPTLVLPDTLPVSDLIRLSTPQIWFPGRRVSTELYRSGRIKGVSYLASTPLGQEGAWLGLLIVGDRQSQPMPNLSQLMSVLGANLSTAIEQNILVTNQQMVIDQQQQALNMQNVLMEHVREGVIVVGPDLTILGINPIAEVMLGYTEKDVKNQPVDNIVIGSERLIPALNAALTGIPTHNLGQSMLHRRDGQAFPAMIQTIPVEKDGKVQTTLVLMMDISADEQNRIRTQQLEQRAVIGEVINAFAHEVRNPINNISLGLTDLSSEFTEEDPKQEMINRIQANCMRLNHLMESILSSSRPLEQRFETVELQYLLRKIVERWRPRLAKVNVVPFTDLDPKTPPIKGDPRALDQIFTNLISNAVDAMDKQGGGTLSLKLAPLNIIPNLPQVEISVTDDGPGIPDELKDHIFEPFVSNKPRGTGLGLAITKQIVTAHRGSVQLNTFPGGTVFSVILPAFLDGEK